MTTTPLKAVQAMAAGDLAKSISFFGMMEKPAAEFLGMANNHSVHHRGQRAAYLRGIGSKVPAICGGSADEPMPGAGLRYFPAQRKPMVGCAVSGAVKLR